MRRILGSALLGLILQLAWPSAKAADCLDTATTQSDLDVCAAQKAQAADQILNKMYQQIVKKLGDDQNSVKNLVRAQRAWIVYRDAECRFSADDGPDSGSIYPFIADECIEDLTKERIKDFQYFLSCKEGDLSCPLAR